MLPGGSAWGKRRLVYWTNALFWRNLRTSPLKDDELVTTRSLPLLLIGLSCLGGCSESAPLRYIAHAGGGVVADGAPGPGHTYTNSREALDQNYAKGHRLFELDFTWTSDARLVALHDWEGNQEQLFGDRGQRSYQEFRQARSRYGLTHLDLADVMDWLEAHPDARLVTDIKEHNVAGLTALATEHPALVHRVIPQIYARAEYDTVRSLGYSDIIYTLYRSRDGDSEVGEFARDHPLFAVTMPPGRVNGGLGWTLREMGVAVFTHTINDGRTAARMARRGLIDGIYTDFLAPGADGDA